MHTAHILRNNIHIAMSYNNPKVSSANYRGHVEVCRELIASVANVEAKDKQQRTPLAVAVDNNRANIARVLCKAGASTSVIADTASDRSALHIAANKGFTDCADVLLQHGAAVDGNSDK